MIEKKPFEISVLSNEKVKDGFAKDMREYFNDGSAGDNVDVVNTFLDSFVQRAYRGGGEVDADIYKIDLIEGEIKDIYPDIYLEVREKINEVREKLVKVRDML